MDHSLLDHIQHVVNKLSQQPIVIVAPFLLTLSDDELSSRLGQVTWNERARKFQADLLHTNHVRESQLPVFYTVPVNMDDIQATIDTMQSIVLAQIAEKT